MTYTNGTEALQTSLPQGMISFTDDRRGASSHDLHFQLAAAHTRLQAQEARIKTLEHLVYIDDLTGLCNRRALDAAIAQELDRCRRGLSRGGLIIMIDLDNFKAINDSFGHLAGDACLQAFADALSLDTRAIDTAARLGGDELAVLMTNADKNQSIQRIQSMAWRLNHLTFMWQGHVIALRASVGVREFTGHESADSLLASADASLYMCKSHQRRRAEESVVA